MTLPFLRPFLTKRGLPFLFQCIRNAFILYFPLYLHSKIWKSLWRCFRDDNQGEIVIHLAQARSSLGRSEGPSEEKKRVTAFQVFTGAPGSICGMTWLSPPNIVESFTDFLFSFLSLHAFAFGAGWPCLYCNCGSRERFLIFWVRLPKDFS